MSDHYIILIPEDPYHVPDEDRAERAREYLHELAPEADAVTVTVEDHVIFFFCGMNWQETSCPSCHAEVSGDWWQTAVEEDYDGEAWLLQQYAMPCCGANHTLHQLRYDWPQGFGRFALEAANANIGGLEESHKERLEQILDCKLRLIYRHL